MFSRTNSNQPWFPNSIHPSNIGKMRKLMIEFNNVSFVFQLSIDIKLIDSKGTESELVISENNKNHKKLREKNISSINYCIEPDSTLKTLYLKQSGLLLDQGKQDLSLKLVFLLPI